MNKVTPNLLVTVATATVPQAIPLDALLVAGPPNVPQCAPVATAGSFQNFQVENGKTATGCAHIMAVEPHLSREMVPQDLPEIIRADTDRVLTLREAAQEWDSMTRRPRRENVVLPHDLEG